MLSGCAAGSGNADSWQSHAPESQDYEEVESISWRKYQIARYFGDKGHYWTSDRRRTALKWAVTIVIGIIVALVGIAVQYSTEWLLILKFDRGAPLARRRVIATCTWGGGRSRLATLTAICVG